MRSPRKAGALAMFALLLASCGGKADANGDALLIAVIPKGTTHEFWKSIHSGAVQGSRDAGVAIYWKGPSKDDDRDAQIRVVEDAISRGVDGIVIAPSDNRALVRPLEEAVKEGIPVVVIDSPIDWEGKVSYIGTDNYQGGVVGARALAALLDGKGKVLMMRYFEGSGSTMQREIGFLETVAKEFPGLDVISANQYGGSTTESCYATAENLLNAYPQIDGIFVACEPTTFGMLRALQDSGRAGTIKVVGFDATDKLLEGLRTGQLHGLVLQNPFKMGQMGVQAMADHLAGHPQPKLVDTGTVVATKDNLESPEIRDLIHLDFDRWLK
ncbi:MAG: substrate-binding domain-containing protein [Planctomycetota bacterium]|nr:substrate-binding domain-containing protein [Planctomycetota bacterium]